jgi:mRNA-degrading endonuclease RelE of RelBE toxin-antitoxin system
MYRIELTPEALKDLASLRNFDLRRVVDEIEVQLKDEPTHESRKRKRRRTNQLAEWELRVEGFRVFYLSVRGIFVQVAWHFLLERPGFSG